MEEKQILILLIDDDDVFTDVVRHRLENEGMQVRRAASGDEALKLFPDMLAKGDRPDVIFLDISMPGLNGIDVLEKFHDDPTVGGIPIALFSNFARAQDVAWAQKLGATRTIDKSSILPADVPDIVREMLRGK